MQHFERYETWAWDTDRPVDRDALMAFLETLPAGVLRLKGWVSLTNGYTVDVNVVGRSHDVRVADPASPPAMATALVAIGLRGTPDPFAPGSIGRRE